MKGVSSSECQFPVLSQDVCLWTPSLYSQLMNNFWNLWVVIWILLQFSYSIDFVTYAHIHGDNQHTIWVRVKLYVH